MGSSADPDPSAVDDSALPEKAAAIAQAASLIAVGNVASRLLGLVREIVIATLFGASGLVSAFRVAQIIPIMLYDLLIGGMVSGAFVPIFSEHADRDRTVLWQLASLVLSLAALVTGVLVLIIELAAPQVAFLMAGGFDDELLAVTARLIRITAPAVFFLSLAGVLTGLLYALKRFALPAFTASVFNATIIIVALVGTMWFDWGIEALAIGLLLGSLMQVVLQLPGLRDARLRFAIDLHNPTLRRIGKLCLPIFLGLIISQVAIALDRNLASRTGEQSIAWMQFATTIVQFPLGLVSAAISLAILPTLSRLAVRIGSDQGPVGEFTETLTMGLRMVIVLIVPAAAALFLLAEPIVALLFQRGEFSAFDTQQTALALRFYLLGLTFAAIDLPLIFAYYARQNTLTPALVGLLGVGFYLVAALLPTLVRPLRMTDLVIANSVQLTGHALVMLWLVNRMTPLGGHHLGSTTVKALIGSLSMGLILWFGLSLWQSWLPPERFLGRAILVSILVLVGGAIYFLIMYLLKVPELELLLQLMRRPLSGSKP